MPTYCCDFDEPKLEASICFGMINIGEFIDISYPFGGGRGSDAVGKGGGVGNNY